jgi:hypothetical protein
MSIRRLDPAEWSSYFGTYSTPLTTRRRIDYAEIRVFSPEIGSQYESHWLPLHGITYDPRSDILEVDVDGLGHLVYDPEAIFVDEDNYGLLRLDVQRADGTQEIIELR